MTIQDIGDLADLNSYLEAHALRGLWAREESYWREPEPFGRPHLWKWKTIQRGVEAARRAVPTDLNGARRAILLIHPELRAGSSHTLGMAVQLVVPGESVYAHRHTAAAIRFVIEGNKDIYTITNGEKCVMEPGDLLVQPNSGWHNHVNDSNSDALWIDCLDTGVTSLLRTMFQEPYPSKTLQTLSSPVDSAIRNPGTLAPPGTKPSKLSYKWTETLPALDSMLLADKSPFDGQCLEYRDAATGGPTLPTFSCWIQMLQPGEKTVPHRHTSVHLCHVIKGSGVTEAGGESLVWEKGDFFVVPNWTWHSYRNTSDETVLIFSTTDRPLLEALGMHREEAR